MIIHIRPRNLAEMKVVEPYHDGFVQILGRDPRRAVTDPYTKLPDPDEDWITKLAFNIGKPIDIFRSPIGQALYAEMIRVHSHLGDTPYEWKCAYVSDTLKIMRQSIEHDHDLYFRVYKYPADGTTELYCHHGPTVQKVLSTRPASERQPLFKAIDVLDYRWLVAEFAELSTRFEEGSTLRRASSNQDSMEFCVEYEKFIKLQHFLKTIGDDILSRYVAGKYVDSTLMDTVRCFMGELAVDAFIELVKGQYDFTTKTWKRPVDGMDFIHAEVHLADKWRLQMQLFDKEVDYMLNMANVNAKGVKHEQTDASSCDGGNETRRSTSGMESGDAS